MASRSTSPGARPYLESPVVPINDEGADAVDLRFDVVAVGVRDGGAERGQAVVRDELRRDSPDHSSAIVSRAASPSVESCPFRRIPCSVSRRFLASMTTGGTTKTARITIGKRRPDMSHRGFT